MNMQELASGGRPDPKAAALKANASSTEGLGRLWFEIEACRCGSGHNYRYYAWVNIRPSDPDVNETAMTRSGSGGGNGTAKGRKIYRIRMLCWNKICVIVRSRRLEVGNRSRSLDTECFS